MEFNLALADCEKCIALDPKFSKSWTELKNSSETWGSLFKGVKSADFFIDAVHIHDVYYFDQAIYIRMFCHLPFLKTEFSRITVFWTTFLSDLNSKRLPQKGKHSAGNEGTDKGFECLPESSGDWSKLWGKNEAVQLTFYVQTDQLVIKSEKCTIIMRIYMYEFFQF